MSDNQSVFEIIRDIGYVIQQIEENETVWFKVKNDGDRFYTARSSKGLSCGFSETSRAIEKAYRVTRNNPDLRDVQIDKLLRENEALLAQVAELRDAMHDIEGCTIGLTDSLCVEINKLANNVLDKTQPTE